MNKQILFIHIPKTAGTSFRFSAQNFFGKENTFYDYGLSSSDTSKNILNYSYKQKDVYNLFLEFKKHENLFLSGHFPVGKYMQFFDTLNIFTFLRDPVEQVLSHYKHYVGHIGYKGDIVRFIKDKRFKNRQSKALAGKPIELFGFIGLTEKYDKSLELINYYYGLNLKVISMNHGQDKELTVNRLNKDIIDLIKKENIEDIRIYEKAKKIFDKRVECYENNKIYTHVYIQEKKKSSIKGVAFKNKGTEAVSIKLMDGDKEVNVKATSFRPGMVIQKVPRDGFVGFEYSSKNLNKVILM